MTNETHGLLPCRNNRPYITNGVSSQFVDTWVEVEQHEPTVVRAFKLDGGQRDDDLVSQQPSRVTKLKRHQFVLYNTKVFGIIHVNAP